MIAAKPAKLSKLLDAHANLGSSFEAMVQPPETTVHQDTEVIRLWVFLRLYKLIGPAENTVTQLTEGYLRIRQELAHVDSACRTPTIEPKDGTNLMCAVIGTMP